MVRLLNKEIDNKLGEIINYIKDSQEYKNYLKSKEYMDCSLEIKKLIDEIKQYQKEIVRNPSKKNILDKKINDNLNLLNEDPLYIEYTKNLEEINNMLTIFENKINNYFNNIFN